MSPQPAPSNDARLAQAGVAHRPGRPTPTFGRRAPSADFSIAVARDRGTVIVTIRGEIDTSSARHLEAILNDLIENQENMRVTVDLHHVTQLNADGVAALLVATDHAQHGGVFTVNKPRESVLESLQGVGMADVIPISGHPAAARRPSAGSAGPAHLPEMPRHPSSEPPPSAPAQPARGDLR